MIRTLIIIAVVFLAAIVLYSLLKGKGATSTSSQSSCPSTFTIRGGIAGLENIVYTNQNGQYYSQINAGFGGFSATLPSKKITQADFEAACQKFLNPSGTSTATA